MIEKDIDIIVLFFSSLGVSTHCVCVVGGGGREGEGEG